PGEGQQEKMTFARILAMFSLVIFVAGSPAEAQDEPVLRERIEKPADQVPARLDILGAIQSAHKNFPAIQAAMFHEEAARQEIKKARTAYLPRGDFLIDELRGTSNNITGPLFPQFVVPNIGGGVRGTKNDMAGGWGCATGILATWEPFDFGLRKAKVQYARSV